jgi:hypothetical protein
VAEDEYQPRVSLCCGLNRYEDGTKKSEKEKGAFWRYVRGSRRTHKVAETQQKVNHRTVPQNWWQTRRKPVNCPIQLLSFSRTQLLSSRLLPMIDLKTNGR